MFNYACILGLEITLTILALKGDREQHHSDREQREDIKAL